MRLRSAAVVAALSLTIAGCASAERPAPTPTPPGVPAAASAPVAVFGTLGRPVSIGPLVATVIAAAPWPEAEQTLGSGLRGISVRVRLAAEGGDVSLDATRLQLVDQETGIRYAAGARPGSGDIRLPLVLARGSSIEGLVSFSPPPGGTFALRIVVSPGVSGKVVFGGFDGSSAAVAATPGAQAPVATVGGDACVKVGGGRWDPEGDDDLPPALDEESVKVTNSCAVSRTIGGWTLHDEGRDNVLVFPAGFTIPAGGSVIVYSGTGEDTDAVLHFGRTFGAVWDDAYPERAFLLDAEGRPVSDWSRFRAPG